MKKGILLVLVCLSSFWLKAKDTAFYSAMVQDSFTVPILYDATVKTKIKSLLSNNWRTKNSLEKYALYKEQIEKAFIENDLPVELAIMSLSNTGFNTAFVDSVNGAVGVWPLSFSMAKRYNLHINSYIDQRRSVELSTQATILFLKELYAIYQDWNLVITAFHVGAIKVNLAMRKANNKMKFKEVYPFLDDQSKHTIQNYMAWLYVHKHHDLKLKKSVDPICDTLLVKEDMLISIFSSYTGVTEKNIKELNSVIKKDLIPGRLSPFYLNVPSGKKDTISKLIAFMADSTKKYKTKSEPVYVPPTKTTTSSSGYKTIYYKVKSGDNLGLIADCYDVRVSDLKRWNGIRGTTIYAGKKLKVKVRASKYSKYKYVNGYFMAKKKAVAKKD